MPDREPGITADQALRLIDAAGRHLAQAGKLLSGRPENERGDATEEASILIARAQAEAVLSIAGQLANGVTLSRRTADGISAFADAASSLERALKRFGDPGR